MPPLFDVVDIARRFSGSAAAAERGAGIMDQVAAYANPETELWKRQVSQAWDDPVNEQFRQSFQFNLENGQTREAEKALTGLTTNMLRQGLPGPTVGSLVKPFQVQLNTLSAEAKEAIRRRDEAIKFGLQSGNFEIDLSNMGATGPAGMPASPALTAQQPGTLLEGAPAGQPPPPPPALPDLSSAPTDRVQAAQQQQQGGINYGGFAVNRAPQIRAGDILEGVEGTNLADMPLNQKAALEARLRVYNPHREIEQDISRTRLDIAREELEQKRTGGGLTPMQQYRVERDAQRDARQEERDADAASRDEQTQLKADRSYLASSLRDIRKRMQDALGASQGSRFDPNNPAHFESLDDTRKNRISGLVRQYQAQQQQLLTVEQQLQAYRRAKSSSTAPSTGPKSKARKFIPAPQRQQAQPEDATLF